MSHIPPSAASLRGAVDLSSLLKTSSASAGSAHSSGAAGTDSSVVPVPSLVLEGSDAGFAEVLELSHTVPVIVELWSASAQPSIELAPLLARAVRSYAGKCLLVRVEIGANPQLAEAFQAATAPTVAAVIAGRPVGLFVGFQPAETVRDVLDQVLQLAAQNQVVGTVSAADSSAEQQNEQSEPDVPPYQLKAQQAIEQGNYPAAITEYQQAVAQNPRDQMAVSGLAHVQLLSRIHADGADSDDQVRRAAETQPKDYRAALAVADRDIFSGHIDEAFDRLLGLYPSLPAEEQEAVRARLLEFFAVVGAEDARVSVARRRLTALLY